MLNGGYKITEIHFSWDKIRKPQTIVELKLRKNEKNIVFSSSQEECISYVIHLHSIPHVKDDNADFVYIDDTNKYFELQEKIVNLLTGKQKELVIFEKRPGEDYQKFFHRIVAFEKHWILAEKGVRIGTTKLCQIFYDVGILLIKDNKEEFRLLRKENLRLHELGTLLKESRESDLAVCYSAFMVSPNIPFLSKDHSDIIIGLIVYDLKQRQILSFNLNSLMQFQTKTDNIGKQGLWECLFNLFERTKCEGSFRSFLPLPLNIRDFTPLPWFCIALMQGISADIKIGSVELDLPLFLAFGSPLVLQNKPSYSFDAKKQVAFIMLGYRENEEQFYPQLRFDVSKGEPKLHLDFQVYYENKSPRKILSHSVVNFKDIWDFSEDLAIGFLLASVYDVNFDTVIIPERISGIHESFRANPLTVYPLFVRSMAGKPFRLIRNEVKLFDTLHQVARREKVRKKAFLKRLENMGLIKDNRLTILGDIVHARLLQTKKRSP